MSKAIDASVLGYSADDIAAMTAEERADALREVLNRAADMLQAAADAFASELGWQRANVRAAAQSVIAVARGPVVVPESTPGAARKPYRVYRKDTNPRPDGCDFDTEEPAIERCKALAKAEPGVIFYVDSTPNARTIFRANGDKSRRT